MRKLTALAAVAALCCAAPVFACDKDKETAGSKHSGCQGKGAQTAAAKVMEKLPSMTYRVGDFETGCPKTAAEKAGAEGKIQYIVDGKTYDCKGQATGALAGLIEKEAADMMTVRYSVGQETFGCPMAAKDAAAQKNAEVTYRLAGLTFKSQDEAQSVAKLVSDAVAKMAQPEGAAPAPEGAPAATGGCSKMKAETAGAKGCGKDKAATASATGGCPHAKAETASASGGSDTAKAETASAAGGCGKDKAATASAASGCCKGKPASECCKTKGATASGDCCADAEKRLASARAKLEVIIETVLASSKS